MPTVGQALDIRSNINTYVSLAFIVTFTFACALVLWHAAFNINPIEKLLLPVGMAEYNAY